ncbi:hypothetical protein [Rubritalea tangerina]|uniref:hypothetical protein n=1 Tax=Rubritalea tangerina TaxID=430798 RepID=UPI00360AAD2F
MKVVHKGKDGKGTFTTGSGKGHELKVVPKRWAVQFRPTGEVWFYDGDSTLHLYFYKETEQGASLKVSSSNVIPALIKRAPKNILAHMQKVNLTNKTKL